MKSVASSKVVGGQEEELATASVGVAVAGVEDAAAVVVAGVVDAKRIAAPLRIKREFCENCGLVYVLEIDAPVLERSGFSLMEPF